MRAQKRLLIALAAFAAAGLAGCLNSPDSASSQSVPVTESEIQAALASALKGDSLHPAPPPRPIVCDTLKARLAALDTAAPNYAGLSNAVARVCAARPDSLGPRPPKPPRPDSLRADSLRPKPDSLRPLPPKPPKPDSLRPAKPDSLRPVPPVKPDSARPQPPKAPKPPKK